MITLIQIELRKLNGSLALLLALAAPALPGALAALSIISADRSPQWASIYTGFVLPIWTLFLMPMVVAAFTTLVGQVEVRARGWDHLLALPIAKCELFLAKSVVVLASAALMTLLVLLFTWVGASIGGAISGHAPLGSVAWGKLAQRVSLLLAGTTMLIVIQLWVALRFASFVMPLMVGIGGTLVALAVAMTGTDQAAWFPWVLPLKILNAPDPTAFAVFGATGGLVLLGVMIVHLSHHNFR